MPNLLSSGHTNGEAKRMRCRLARHLLSVQYSHASRTAGQQGEPPPSSPSRLPVYYSTTLLHAHLHNMAQPHGSMQGQWTAAGERAPARRAPAESAKVRAGARVSARVEGSRRTPVAKRCHAARVAVTARSRSVGMGGGGCHFGCPGTDRVVECVCGPAGPCHGAAATAPWP